MTNTPQGPLTGIRVVDLTSVVFGPYATQIMADMGADVIKIEPPGGDDMRHVTAGPAPGYGSLFVNVNRGKRSVELDLKTESAREQLRTLIGTADVFIHSMRAKAIARLGFSYDDVKAIKPDIIYTNCYGYSRRGPDADLPAYDDTIQAECGLTHVQRLISGEPGFVGTIVADKVSGLTALYATMMALFHRERTGEGQEVEVGMFETMASFMLVEHAGGQLYDPPIGPAVYPRAASPARKPMKTRDGHIAALVYNNRHWTAFIDAVRPEWVTPDMATLPGRARQIDHVYTCLAGTFATRTTAEWIDLLRELHIPFAPLRSTDDLFNNDHLNAIGFFEELDTPHGRVRHPGIPTWFSKTPGKIANPAPDLGAHNGELLDKSG